MNSSADAGMKPLELITASTSTPAAVLVIADLGTIAVGKTAHFLAMPNNPLEKMANIKDVGSLYLNGSEQERTSLIQGIQIKTDVLTITAKDRAKDAAEEAELARQAKEALLTHY